jgi:hypothetical protein
VAPNKARLRSIVTDAKRATREATSGLPINSPVSQGRPYEFTFTGGRKGRFAGLHALFYKAAPSKGGSLLIIGNHDPYSRGTDPESFRCLAL